MNDQREDLYAAGKWPSRAKADPAWTNIETAEVEFLNNLAEKGGLADPAPGMLRHCAKLLTARQVTDNQGYVDAFYELAKMLDIPAMAISPKQAWETVIRPRLEARMRSNSGIKPDRAP